MSPVHFASQTRIRIEALRLRTYVGINEDEIRKRQDVVIHVDLWCDARAAVETNRIEEALNYRTICKDIIDFVENGRFALLERMTHEVLERVMAYEGVSSACVEIAKPFALRFSDAVSVRMEAHRESA